MKKILSIVIFTLFSISPVKAEPDLSKQFTLPNKAESDSSRQFIVEPNFTLPSSNLEINLLSPSKTTNECIPPKTVKDVVEALKYYGDCTLNQFIEVTGLFPESSVSMPDLITIYKFVGRARDGFFTTPRTCILQIGVNTDGKIVKGGFQSAAKGIILNGRGHCLKILRGEKKDGGLNVPLKDIY